MTLIVFHQGQMQVSFTAFSFQQFKHILESTCKIGHTLTIHNTRDNVQMYIVNDSLSSFFTVSLKRSFFLSMDYDHEELCVIDPHLLLSHFHSEHLHLKVDSGSILITTHGTGFTMRRKIYSQEGESVQPILQQALGSSFELSSTILSQWLQYFKGHELLLSITPTQITMKSHNSQLITEKTIHASEFMRQNLNSSDLIINLVEWQLFSELAAHLAAPLTCKFGYEGDPFVSEFDVDDISCKLIQATLEMEEEFDTPPSKSLCI